MTRSRTMNTSKFKRLKLEALDSLNQNQRIELIKHEFNEVLNLKDDDDGFNEKIEDLLEIEKYLNSKGYYGDVLYARYVALGNKYLQNEIHNSILKTNTINLVIGGIVYDLWERYFILTYLLDTYYQNYICYTYLPMKHQDDELIFDDTFTIRNKHLTNDLDSLISMIHEQILKDLNKLSKNDKFNIQRLEDIDDEDGEINNTIREYYHEVIDGMEKLKEDGFILAKELELEVNKEIWNEYNEKHEYKPNDDGYFDVDKLTINNHVSYDLDECELVFNENYIDFERKEDRMYLLLKPLGIDDE